MNNWSEISRELEHLLHLQTYPVAYKKLDKEAELKKIPDIQRINRPVTFCQLPTLVRRAEWTIGVTKNEMLERCARVNGLAPTTDKELAMEAAAMSTTWFANEEEAKKQLAAYPLITPGEALVLSPLAAGKIDPDVVLLYANPAQIMMLLCALQFHKFERFQFSFIGEGACSDGLAQCYLTGKPALAIPCFGERAFGSVPDDEMVIALPPGYLERIIKGLKELKARELSYPIMFSGPECDPVAVLTRVYPGPEES